MRAMAGALATTYAFLTAAATLASAGFDWRALTDQGSRQTGDVGQPPLPPRDGTCRTEQYISLQGRITHCLGHQREQSAIAAHLRRTDIMQLHVLLVAW